MGNEEKRFKMGVNLWGEKKRKHKTEEQIDSGWFGGEIPKIIAPINSYKLEMPVGL